jgi:hypothetical protein
MKRKYALADTLRVSDQPTALVQNPRPTTYLLQNEEPLMQNEEELANRIALIMLESNCFATLNAQSFEAKAGLIHRYNGSPLWCRPSA